VLLDFCGALAAHLVVLAVVSLRCGRDRNAPALAA
jgi:hypothetical protein